MADTSRIPHDGGPSSAPAAPALPVEDEAEPRHRISLIKGPQRWHFRWEPGDEASLINRVAEMARDPRIDFDWYDAAIVCKHIAQPFGSASKDLNA